MAQYSGSKYGAAVSMASRRQKNPLIADALENGLIFITLLMAIGTALYILNGQLIELL